MKNVIFDLDLTLLDTLDDLKEAMNYVLRTFGFPERTKTEINSFIGNGIRKLITRSLPTGSSEELIEKGVLLFKVLLNFFQKIAFFPFGVKRFRFKCNLDCFLFFVKIRCFFSFNCYNKIIL